MNVTIEERVLDEIFSQAKKNTDEEVIGLLLGSLEEDEMIITDYLTGPTESSRIHASLSREFLAKITQKKIDGKLKAHILGWYHSHPDYGCFMSDRDAATQENIQNLYADAVALVIDPVRNDSKLYRMVGGNYIEVPFRVKENRQKERRENNSTKRMGVPRMPHIDAKMVTVVFLVCALIASDVGLVYLWNKNSQLQNEYTTLTNKYRALYNSVNRVMVVTDRFDILLADFGHLVTLSTSEQLRKSFCNFLITYLKNFKKMNTATLESQFDQKNYNILISEGTSMLATSPIIFTSENNVTVDIQMKDLSKIVVTTTDTQALSSFNLLLTTYLADLRDVDVSRINELSEGGEYKRAIEEGIILTNRRPSIIIESPAEGEKAIGVFKVTWKALDPDGVITSLLIEYRNIYEVSWNPLGENLDATSNSYEWDTSALPDGEYLLRITVTDDVGEKATTESGIFTMKNKNTPPTLVLVSPIDNQTLKGSVDIIWNASDDDGDTLNIRLEFSLDGGVKWNILAIVKSMGSYTWSLSSIPAGNCLLKVTVDDSRGGTSTIQVKVVVIK
jgi:proteasome lid subunit RPN8/RPN11